MPPNIEAWIFSGVAGLAGFLARDWFSSSRKDSKELATAVATLSIAVAEVKILVGRLDGDVKELWRVRTDIDRVWDKLRERNHD